MFPQQCFLVCPELYVVKAIEKLIIGIQNTVEERIIWHEIELHGNERPILKIEESSFDDKNVIY